VSGVPQTDLEIARRRLELLVEPGAVFEIRALTKNEGGRWRWAEPSAGIAAGPFATEASVAVRR